MSINIDPEKFAELVVTSNPAKSDDAEDIAKESLISREICKYRYKLL